MASSYNTAKQIYADFGVDTEKAMEVLDKIPLSMHCWQGDDVGGFETPDATLGCGGIQATGNFPGKARSVDELRADIDEALKYIPGKTRINLHAIYGEFFGKKVDRDEISFDNFKGWTDWCKDRKMGIDFNPTFFSHPLAADGFTLSSADKSVRKFWIAHAIACRKIAEKIGKALSDTVITNFWMPDGMKDFPADRLSPRERMAASLDEIFSVKISKKYARDAVESKLFGIGSESYVVGSHEFFMGYAVKNGLIHIKGKPFGFMYTENKYSNFRLHVEWKYPIEGSNSGIFLFLQEPTKELWPNAVECQLCSGRAGDFVLLGGSDVSEYKAPEGKPRPKFPVVERFVKERENPVGEWNSADIICKDGNIEVYINGALQNIGTKSAHSKGYIGLQSEGGDILFRNVRLTPID